MSVSDDLNVLLFPCECVSSRSGKYSEPWASVSQKKLLPDGTKEQILNIVAREPRTISQIAAALNLAPPSVHTHINDMLKSELLRESAEWEKRYPTERYYEPNFPVLKADECAEFEMMCQETSQRVAELFEAIRPQMERAFSNTRLAERGWTFLDITQYLYANVQRGARQLLEQHGSILPPQKHANDAEWVFWAEES